MDPQGPTPIPVTLTYSANPTYTLPQQPYKLPNIANFDGDLPVATSSDPTIVQDSSNWTWDGFSFDGGNMTGQPKAGTATVTVTLDGQPVAIFAVTTQEAALETAPNGAQLLDPIPAGPPAQAQTQAAKAA